jgi:hypothetical protein
MINTNRFVSALVAVKDLSPRLLYMLDFPVSAVKLIVVHKLTGHN